MKADVHRAITSAMLGPLVTTLLLLAAFSPGSYAHAAYPDSCELLKDESQRALLGSGLERKLMILCGEVAQPLLEQAQPLLEQPLQGNGILVSDPWLALTSAGVVHR